MDNQNIIIYQFTSLSLILKELESNLNFKIIEATDRNSLDNSIKNLKKYLIITKKSIPNLENQLIIKKLPIKIFDLVEKINIKLLKFYFKQNSQYKIGNYIIDLNSREISYNEFKFKLTEKEVDTIIYLSKVDKPVNVEELQAKVWGYNFEIETHTVETHIYRLRKKILNYFKDSKFITSHKNGYQIKLKK